MELRLYDTLTGEKRLFKPIDSARVRMYVCGPTVYDFAHIGNARPVIVFDVLFRLLRYLYGDSHVTYVRNITDVDDKINARAAQDFPGLPLNEAIRKVTEVTAAQFHDDVASLGCLPPTFEPRATDFVLPRADGKTDMVTLIKQLIARGHAYEAGGEVLFDTQSMPDYGALSRRKLDEQRPGARVAVDAHKRNPLDFVLWKLSSGDEPGWESPWGRGRPGWHIECSAMSEAYLDKVFDIHGGGIDLIFPHHENEIAQSRCAHGTPAMANYWMHNGFLQVESEKMSKSLGNFITIRELLADWTGPVVRHAMLQTHYRQPIDWTISRLEQSRQEMGNWAAMYSGSDAHSDYQQRKFKKQWPKPTEALVRALGDDLNTPNATAVLRQQFSDGCNTDGLSAEFFQNCEFLGLLNGANVGTLEDTHVSGSNVQPRILFDAIPSVMKYRVGLANGRPEVIKQAETELAALGVQANDRRDGYVDLAPLDKSSELDTVAINALIADRAAARARKDFKESDRIRDQLAAMKIVLKDGKDANGNPTTTWEVAR
jgi:cysteinyl-tRNA synthetase